MAKKNLEENKVLVAAVEPEVLAGVEETQPEVIEETPVVEPQPEVIEETPVVEPQPKVLAGEGSDNTFVYPAGRTKSEHLRMRLLGYI